MSDQNDRAEWGSKFGFLMAAIGSAVGLGNIWRFSYVAYDNGGAAFMIPYVVAILVAGIPILIVEYGLGHKERGSAPLSFYRGSKKWEGIGWWMPTIATIGINLFYAVVMAWCLRYIMFSFDLSWGANTEAFFFGEFLNIKADLVKPGNSPFAFGTINWDILLSTGFVWFFCWIICFREVNKGIEKACTIFMPLLFILTSILVIWSLTLDGAWDGVKAYLFDVHMEKLASIDTWAAAFGQIFFSLSLGFGIMITYASYLPKKVNITKSALITTVCNCGYSVFAGFAVFATLGFMANAKGVPVAEVVKAGPALAFVTYPEAINQLPFGNSAFGVLFFFTLLVAGLSSGISLIEALTCAIVDKFKFSRGKVVTFICGMGFFGSIVFTTQAGLLVLDIVDHFVNQYGLLVGGLLECLFVGWVVKAKVINKHINDSADTGMRLPKVWNFLVKFVCPVILGSILVAAFYNDVTKGYEGYSATALNIYGTLFMAITVIIAMVLAFRPWVDIPPVHHEHEDKIFDA